MPASAEQRHSFGEALGARLRTREEQVAAANHLGMSLESIRLYVAGEREPDRDAVFELERLLKERPGGLSRLLGYLPVTAKPANTVREAIEADSTLTPTKQRYLLRLYREMLIDE